MAGNLLDQLRALAAGHPGPPAVGLAPRAPQRRPGMAARIAAEAPPPPRYLTRTAIATTDAPAPTAGFYLPGANKLSVQVSTAGVLVWIDPGTYPGQAAPTWSAPPLFLRAGTSWGHGGACPWVRFQSAVAGQPATITFLQAYEPPA